ncbi:AAA family ATPase [Runella limosa]|uniref:AAA family ATPase n=1 Tax=Runella limosa TaxID=370978 RepID=UPI00041FA912|nr:ATP-binding protein [Runella limosa]
MDKIIGRKEEVSILEKIKTSGKPEFVAVYGRRRVGKTYLIRQFFKHQFTFYLTGMANANTPLQLGNFISAYRELNHLSDERIPQNWFEAFALLKHLIESKGEKLCIVFLDELPWMDTPRSNFVMALEHFWNSYGSSKNNLKLITCGSAASWMINKLINNHGGLHNRVTKRIHIHPFTLDETQQFLQAKNIVLERYQIAELYLILGGIPFYLEEVEEGLSVAQNIDRLCFSETGLFRNEYQNLFKSLFKDSETHQSVVEALAGKLRGLQRDEIIKLAKIPNGGNTTKVLEELESSGFIRKYVPLNNKIRNSLYQLTDPFVLFYHQFMKNTKAVGEGVWMSFVDGSLYKTWTGYAFENLCLLHITAIKKALGINGIYSENASWRSKENNAQIDLLIDRKDKVITICEMKFSNDEFVITKDYADKLRRKLNVFRTESKTKKSVFLCMITTFGIHTNQYSLGLVQNSLTLEDLFVK